MIPSSLPPTLRTYPESSVSPKAAASPQHLSLSEISHLLEPKAFAPKQNELPTELPEDKWSLLNSFRSMVTPALNKGLSEIIAQNAKEDCPIIEIGSGIGYTLSENLSQRTIRTQTSTSECQLLRKSITDPIYQVNIDELCKNLSDSGKKVPFFFALHVFDTMSPEERKANLLKLSKLQEKGDRVLFMLDANPCLDNIAKELEARFPGHAALPNMPLTNAPCKQSFIMVPVQYIGCNPTDINLPEMINEEALLRTQGFVSKMHLNLQQLQKEQNLKVVMLEDFFVEQMIHELTDVGYSHNAYYHASFTTSTVDNQKTPIKQDLLYRPVTDAAGSIRQWSLNDKNFIGRLQQKGLQLPSNYDEAFLQDLRSKGQKIIGTEILVIEATKN